MPQEKSLTVDDPNDQIKVESWLDKTALKLNAKIAFQGDEDALNTELQRHAGNVLPAMTMPYFAANIILNVSWLTMLINLPRALFMDGQDRNRLLLNYMYKIKGIDVLRHAVPVYNLTKATRYVVLKYLWERGTKL